jgi:transposase
MPERAVGYAVPAICPLRRVPGGGEKRLEPSAARCGLGILRRLVGEKAESAVRRVVDVETKYSSQECSKCGTIAAKSRRRRRFARIACGFTLHAGLNAALVIRERAQLALASEPYPAEDVGRRARCTA